MLRRPVLLLAALLLGCGNPDNLVIGSISATPNSPVAILNDVRSSIAGLTTRTDLGKSVSVVILSDFPKLCDKLAVKPDFFRVPDQQYVALVLFAPPDRAGTFYLGTNPDTDFDAEVIATNAGVTPTKFLAQLQGYLTLSEFGSKNGQESRGSFDTFFFDPITRVGKEFYGKFKATGCEALAATLLP